MEIRQANENERYLISTLWVNAFWEAMFKFFKKDKEVMFQAMEHAVNCEYTHVAVIEHSGDFQSSKHDEIAGVVVCVPNGVVATKTDRKVLVKYLGFIKGNILHYAVMITNKFPFEVDDKTGIIEILATHENHRCKGIGTALMKHIFDIHSFDTYVLEVVDTNESAIKMYEKIGFKEVMRKKSPFLNSPHKYSVYMRCEEKSKG